MKKRTSFYPIAVFVIISTLLALFIQGCGGGGGGTSFVSGTVADVNRNVLIGAEVWVGDNRTESLVAGTYRLNGVASGWRTVRARTVIDGVEWVGSTAAEILRNEPTFNINIVLIPEGELTDIRGTVYDDTNHRVEGARLLLTTQLVDRADTETGPYVGPYGSIVAITDSNGEYVMEDVPSDLNATIAASKVGFVNDEVDIVTGINRLVNFDLEAAGVTIKPDPPILAFVESYTMPDTITRSDASAFKAIRAYTSTRYRAAILKPSQQQRQTRATPEGSLIEIDLYFNALDVNSSEDIAGYGIYRATGSTSLLSAIDFIRDPYANFYGDTGVELTPGRLYTYAVTAVDVQFLDQFDDPIARAESDLSNELSVTPLGQLRAESPAQGADVSGNPIFRWFSLSRAEAYTVYLYDRFPTLPLDPEYPYGVDDPAPDQGIFPIWPRRGSEFAGESTVGGAETQIVYNGPTLIPGRTYYWVVLAQDFADNENDNWAAYSYSQLRTFTAQ